MIKTFLKGTKFFINYILSIILIFMIDSFIVKSLFNIGFIKWLATLIKNTSLLYLDFSLLNYIKVMGLDLLAVVISFAILYWMFFTIPNTIADIMGYNLIDDKNKNI